uniref:Uncharacterized protein n=1 Tax=Rhodnius prolixus TaxID=13249 RepID=T1HGH7_RHOPR
MEYLLCLVCLLGVVSSVPVDVEQVEILQEVVPLEVALNDDDASLLNKENKRVIRQHDINDLRDPLLIAKSPMDGNPMDGTYSADCMPIYGRTHGMSQLDIGHPMTYGSGGFKYGLYGAQSAAQTISAAPYSQDSQFTEQQSQHTYFTTVPYISGYRMSPIYSEKKIIVKDFARPDLHGNMMFHGAGIHQYPHEHLLRSSNDEMSGTMLDRGMDFNIIFGQPLNSLERSVTSELKSADEYDSVIEDLKQRLEHLESLRENINDNENYTE